MMLRNLAFFRENVLEYQSSSQFQKPWEQGADLYSIWIFEVVMQQTRLSQGIPYYERILNRFPTVQELAEAPIQSVYEVWKGLGYYSRARNLQLGAQKICKKWNGEFPNNYTDFLEIPGVGPYTAAALASFGRGEDIAVLDGNVYRVLARFFGDFTSMHLSGGKKHYMDLAQKCLPKGKSAAYNQAIMNLGSEICRPQLPSCEECLLKSNCKSYKMGWQALLPTPKVRNKLKKRYFYCIFPIYKNQIWLQPMPKGDIWEGLLSGIWIETEELPEKNIENCPFEIPVSKLNFSMEWQIQKLSHVEAHVKFELVELEKKPTNENWYNIAELSKIPLPRVVDKWLGNIEFKKIFQKQKPQ